MEALGPRHSGVGLGLTRRILPSSLTCYSGKSGNSAAMSHYRSKIMSFAQGSWGPQIIQFLS